MSGYLIEKKALQHLKTPEFRHHILCRVQGSGPMGESKQDSVFHTLTEHPDSLSIGALANSEKIIRKDLDIGPGGLAFTISNILTREEADQLVALTESMGYSRFAPSIRTPPGMRQNKACHWFAPQETVDKFLNPMFQRFQHLLPQTIDEGDQLYNGLSHRMAHYKYDSGDVFNKHTDGAWPGQSINENGDDIVSWDSVESKLSMLLYLSDDNDNDNINNENSRNNGGATRLYRFDGGNPVDVIPKKGHALFFRHGFGSDSVLHAGMKLIGDKPKYVCRLNVLYEDSYNL